MRGDINAKMADGIEDSAAILVFITENYMVKVAGKGGRGEDDNCKYEFGGCRDRTRRAFHPARPCR